jgi:hypothetical protein
MNIPLEVCEARDPKGLYKKARAGLIKNFTGAPGGSAAHTRALFACGLQLPQKPATCASHHPCLRPAFTHTHSSFCHHRRH